MPYGSLEELEQSALYKRSLTKLSRGQLAKFLEVFNEVHSRVTRNGGDAETAESQAIAIALSVAKNHRPRNEERMLEASIHFYAPMMKHQIAGADNPRGVENRFDFIRANPSVASAAVSGNEFNDDHDPNAGLGIVHGFVLPEQAPSHIRSQFDPATPFLLTASYYADVPEEKKRLRGISSEWLPIPLSDGSFEVLPLTFAKSETPLNPTASGIKKVASLQASTTTMTATTNAATTIVSFNVPNEDNSYKQIPAESPAVASMTEIETLKASLVAKDSELSSFRVQLASLTGKPADQLKAEDIASLATEFASLKTNLKTAQEQIDQLKGAALGNEAMAWATDLAEKQNKIAMDAVETWAASYVKDAETAKTLAASLKPSVLPATPATAATAVPQVSDERVKSIAMLAFEKPKVN